MDILQGSKFVMMKKSTGEFEVVTTLEKAYEMLQSHEYLMGYLSFADLDTINAVIKSCAEQKVAV